MRDYTMLSILCAIDDLLQLYKSDENMHHGDVDKIREYVRQAFQRLHVLS